MWKVSSLRYYRKSMSLLTSVVVVGVVDFVVVINMLIVINHHDEISLFALSHPSF